MDTLVVQNENKKLSGHAVKAEEEASGPNIGMPGKESQALIEEPLTSSDSVLLRQDDERLTNLRDCKKELEVALHSSDAYSGESGGHSHFLDPVNRHDVGNQSLNNKSKSFPTLMENSTIESSENIHSSTNFSALATFLTTINAEVASAVHQTIKAEEQTDYVKTMKETAILKASSMPRSKPLSSCALASKALEIFDDVGGPGKREGLHSLKKEKLSLQLGSDTSPIQPQSIFAPSVAHGETTLDTFMTSGLTVGGVTRTHPWFSTKQLKDLRAKMK